MLWRGLLEKGCSDDIIYKSRQLKTSVRKLKLGHNYIFQQDIIIIPYKIEVGTLINSIQELYININVWMCKQLSLALIL